MLQSLANERPDVIWQQIHDTIAQIPIQPRMLDALQMAVELFHADVKIISDKSNMFCIERFLDSRELRLRNWISEIIANPVEYETLENTRTSLRIRPYHGDHLQPHGCQWCPSNLCKGSILDSIRRVHAYTKVIYIGDGIEDFCPARRLSENDIVLARHHLINGDPYGLQRQINAHPGVLKAAIVPWSTGYDVYRRLVQLCHPLAVVPHPLSRRSGSVLVLFDYDWSLVNENSDTFIFQKLYPELLWTLQERCARQPSWTQVMDDMLGDLANEKPEISADTVRDTVASIPIQPRMIEALRLAAEHHGADVKIVSDANTVYIASMVQRYGLDHVVSEIITNPAAFEAFDNGRRTRLRVRPYHDANVAPHGCTWCPHNMCKGRIVETLRTLRSYTSVLYVGDGSGDFCAATRLTKNDIVFARADDADGKTYGLQQRINRHRHLVEASVVPWRTGEDIYRYFKQYFHAPQQPQRTTSSSL